mgnify:CR=1 FL=1
MRTRYRYGVANSSVSEKEVSEHPMWQAADHMRCVSKKGEGDGTPALLAQGGEEEGCLFLLRRVHRGEHTYYRHLCGADIREYHQQQLP